MRAARTEGAVLNRPVQADERAACERVGALGMTHDRGEGDRCAFCDRLYVGAEAEKRGASCRRGAAVRSDLTAIGRGAPVAGAGAIRAIVITELRTRGAVSASARGTFPGGAIYRVDGRWSRGGGAACSGKRKQKGKQKISHDAAVTPGPVLLPLTFGNLMAMRSCCGGAGTKRGLPSASSMMVAHEGKEHRVLGAARDIGRGKATTHHLRFACGVPSDMPSNFVGARSVRPVRDTWVPVRAGASTVARCPRSTRGSRLPDVCKERKSRPWRENGTQPSTVQAEQANVAGFQFAPSSPVSMQASLLYRSRFRRCVPGRPKRLL